MRKNDNLKRAYHIPGGKKVKIGVAIIGLFVSIFAFFISFFPPNDIGYGKGGTYLTILIISWLIILSMPFLIYKIFDENGNNK